MEPLLYIYNLSFSTEVVPDKLKVAKVIPIYKKWENAQLATTDLSHY